MRAICLLWISFITCFMTGCPKSTPPALTASEIEQARAVFVGHLEAIGATDGIPHTGLKMTGSMEYFGESSRNNFTLEQQHPNLYYIRISLAGTGVFERGFDGETFWERTPRESRILSKSETLALQPAIDFQRWVNHKKWYPTITNFETLEFAGEICLAVTASTHHGNQERLLFSKNSGLLIGIEQIGETNSITRYGQYLIHDDIKVPTYWEDKRNGVHRIWKVEQFEWDRNDVDFRPPPSLLEDR